MAQPDDVIRYVSKRLSEFFILTNKPYDGATDFDRENHLLKRFSREDKRDGVKLVDVIHKIVIKEVGDKFSLYPKKIGGSKLEIDFWDENEKIAYEIVLGNGDEIWKDILKAILMKANKLVIYCRNYPDEYIRGYREIKNVISNLEPFLRGKLEVETILIEPIRTCYFSKLESK